MNIRRDVIDMLMSRDRLTLEEAEQVLGRAQSRVHEGENPEVVLYEDLELSDPTFLDAINPHEKQ